MATTAQTQANIAEKTTRYRIAAESHRHHWHTSPIWGSFCQSAAPTEIQKILNLSPKPFMCLRAQKSLPIGFVSQKRCRTSQTPGTGFVLHTLPLGLFWPYAFPRSDWLRLYRTAGEARRPTAPPTGSTRGRHAKRNPENPPPSATSHPNWVCFAKRRRTSQAAGIGFALHTAYSWSAPARRPYRLRFVKPA